MPESVIWVRFRPERVESCLDKNIFVVCLESVDLQMAEYLNGRLEKLPYYFGALEVDDASPVHWNLYSGSLIAKYRVINKKVSIFWDGFNEDSQDQFAGERLTGLGFKEAAYESLNGKFSIFDKYHDFEHARRVAEWKRKCGSLLAFISDDVVSRLSDAAPELSEKLWAALNTFEAAETGEQLAQVAVSCRRIIEFVADSLFAPSTETHKGFSLGKKDFRNRLLAFADKERASETNIDLICASTAALAEQLEKLSALTNKGIHGEVFRSESRRCLLRTILLLDDIISLKPSAFEIASHIDVEEMLDFLNTKERQ